MKWYPNFRLELLVDPKQGEGFYRLATRLRTTIVVTNELPTTPDTLW